MRRRASSLLAVVFCIGVLSLPLWVSDQYMLSTLTQIAMYSTAALGAWLLLAAGLWSFGQGVFAIFGAYTAALMAIRLGVPLWLAIPAGGVVAAAVSLGLAPLMLRTRGVAFAILSIVWLLAIDQVVSLTPQFSGGRPGLFPVPPPPAISIFGNLLDFSSPGGELCLMSLIFVACFVVTRRIRHSRYFEVLSAIRQDETLARSVGIRANRYRAMVFSIAGCFAGLVGAFSASYLAVANTKVWYTFPSILIIGYAIIGGVRSVYGPVVGAAVAIGGTELLRATQELQTLFVGVGLAVITLFLPGGLISIPVYLRDLAKQVRRGRLEAPPTPTEMKTAPDILTEQGSGL